jgi:predicted small lipoprotein YifL
MMTVQTLNPTRFLAAGLLCLSLAGCGGPSEGPEAALRAWVSQGHERAEEKDRRGLVDMISPDYVDARGNSRDDISDLFRIYFLRTHTVALITRIDELNVYGDDAGEVVLTVGMAGTNDGTFGFSADAYKFEMEFEREGDDWLLTSARWGELGGDLH